MSIKRVLLAFAHIVFLTSFLSCISEEIRTVRALPIRDIDLSQVRDGAYEGSFSYGAFNYLVRSTVKKNRIVKVEIIKNRDTDYAKRAEGVVERVLEKQTPNVDAVSGATTTSKALLKAIENSLSSAVVR